jgi:pimeloyl-ACP methyl ester carboxylesterase/DNA-binding CsgD family transcriptional regulator
MVRHVEEQPVLFCRASDGTSLAHCATGNGPPLVRVTAWLTHLKLEWTNPVWSHWLAALAPGRTLVRYDPRGCGLSDRSPADLSLHAMVEDLAAVVDNLALDALSLLGFGQGGVVAVAFAARHPERVRRLVLCGSYVQGALTERADPLKKREAEAVAQIIEVSWGRQAAPLRQILANLLMPGASPEQQQALSTLQRSSAYRQTAARLWRVLQSVDISDLARGVRAPTLVLHVSDDALVPADAGLQLASLIPHARHVAVTGKNHVLLEDEPAWPILLAEMQDFLSDETGPEAAAAQDVFAGLTPRERHILELIARGLSNAEIAERLVITPKTVRNHVSHIYTALGVNSRPRAVIAARDAGFGRGPDLRA